MNYKRIAGLFIFVLVSRIMVAQIGGGAVYQNSHGSQRNNVDKISHRVFISDTTLLLEARILVNQKADFYNAVFGIATEAATIAKCHRQMNNKIEAFTQALQSLGINSDNYYVDYISQNRVYDFERDGMELVEKLTGFEFKKNVIVRFKDLKMLEDITAAAADQGIFDLIKVDYLIENSEKLQQKLFDEAVKVINSKKERYLASTNSPKIINSRIYQLDCIIYQPIDMYESYKAFESGSVGKSYYNKADKQTINQRKMSTFYFEPLNSGNFDRVLNPNPIAPCLQVSYTLQMWYELQH